VKTISFSDLPTADDILVAEKRIHPYIHQTPVLTSSQLNQFAGRDLFFKCENLQKAGAFKSRGAMNAVLSLSLQQLKAGVATHSSGNHAQALARAAMITKTRSWIVMPETAPKVKVNAVMNYGGEIIFCKPTLKDREDTLGKVLERTGATPIHPYNDLRIITGQATACHELIGQCPPLDLVLCPVGGGGLLSGTLLSRNYFSPQTDVIACEPVGANDAWQSFQSKTLVPSVNPNTIADGLLTSLGSLTFPIIMQFVKDVVTVDDASIIQAMRMTWERMKIVIEPSAAVCLAAIIENKIPSKYQRIGIILSGGNVDLNKLPWIKA
jgi:threonine dehydratase